MHLEKHLTFKVHIIFFNIVPFFFFIHIFHLTFRQRCDTIKMIVNIREIIIMKKIKSIIAFQVLMLLLIASFSGMLSNAEVTELSIKPNTTESDVHADILLPDATVGVKYQQEATITQVINGFADPSDENYTLYLLMAQNATITDITTVKGTVPEGLTISNTAKSAKFSGTPTKEGNYIFYVDITVKVSIFGQATTKVLRAKVSITVLPKPPVAPTFTNKPEASYEVEKGKNLNISVSISCPQDCNLILYIKQGTSYTRITSKDSSSTWNFDPLSLSGRSSATGNYDFKIEAVNTKDKTLKASCTFSVRVYEKLLPPTNAVISGKGSCTAGETLTFSCTASGNSLSYKWYIKRSGSTSFSSLTAAENSCSIVTTIFDDLSEIKCIVSNDAGQTTSNIIVLNVTQPHIHSFTTKVVYKEASCTSGGIDKLICECGEYKTAATQPNGHKYESEWTVERYADCENDGLKYHKCSVCGDKTDITVITASGHTFGEWVETIAPTYEKEGSKQRRCKTCSFVQTEAVPKLVQSHTHSFTDWVTVKEATCTQTGIRTSTCSCNESKTEIIPAKGHSFSDDYVTIKQPTCTESGSKALVCSSCYTKTSEVTVEAKGHSLGEWIVTKEPTTQAEGESTRYCSDCNYRETKTIAKLVSGHEHSFGEWFETIPADCTQSGEEKHVCSCGLSETRNTAPTGHSFGPWTVTTTQGCENAGKETRICHCGESQQREIPETGHSYGSWTVIVKPANGENGLAQRECSLCGNKDYKEIVDADYTPEPTVEPTTPTETPLIEPPVTPGIDNTQSPITDTYVPDPGKSVSDAKIIIIVACVVTVMLAAGCIAVKVAKSGLNK